MWSNVNLILPELCTEFKFPVHQPAVLRKTFLWASGERKERFESCGRVSVGFSLALPYLQSAENATHHSFHCYREQITTSWTFLTCLHCNSPWLSYSKESCSSSQLQKWSPANMQSVRVQSPDAQALAQLTMPHCLHRSCCRHFSQKLF